MKLENIVGIAAVLMYSMLCVLLYDPVMSISTTLCNANMTMTTYQDVIAEFKGRSIVFAGDSVARILYLELLAVLDPDLALIDLGKHVDSYMDVNGVKARFLWRPFVQDVVHNTSMRVDKDSVFVISVGLWDALHVHQPILFDLEIRALLEMTEAKIVFLSLQSLEWDRITQEDKIKWLTPDALGKYNAIIHASGSTVINLSLNGNDTSDGIHPKVGKWSNHVLDIANAMTLPCPKPKPKYVGSDWLLGACVGAFLLITLVRRDGLLFSRKLAGSMPELP